MTTVRVRPAALAALTLTGAASVALVIPQWAAASGTAPQHASYAVVLWTADRTAGCQVDVYRMGTPADRKATVTLIGGRHLFSPQHPTEPLDAAKTIGAGSFPQTLSAVTFTNTPSLGIYTTCPKTAPSPTTSPTTGSPTPTTTETTTSTPPATTTSPASPPASTTTAPSTPVTTTVTTSPATTSPPTHSPATGTPTVPEPVPSTTRPKPQPVTPSTPARMASPSAVRPSSATSTPQPAGPSPTSSTTAAPQPPTPTSSAPSQLASTGTEFDLRWLAASLGLLVVGIAGLRWSNRKREARR